MLARFFTFLPIIGKQSCSVARSPARYTAWGGLGCAPLLVNCLRPDRVTSTQMCSESSGACKVDTEDWVPDAGRAVHAEQVGGVPGVEVEVGGEPALLLHPRSVTV